MASTLSCESPSSQEVFVLLIVKSSLKISDAPVDLQSHLGIFIVVGDFLGRV